MKESNIRLSALLQRLSPVGLVDDGVLINGSAAISRRSAPDRDELILALFSANHDRPFPSAEQTYGDLRLARESKSVGEIRGRLAEAAKSNSFEVIEGVKIEVQENTSMELLPSDDPQTGIRPKYEIQLSVKSRGYLNQAGPLVAYGQPSYESVEQAVRAWIPLRPFHGTSDARLGSLLIEIPLSAPRLGALTMEGEHKMRIGVLGLPSEKPVEVTGVWQSNDAASIEPFAQKVVGESVEVTRPPWADQVAVWLVRSDSLITDFFFENAGRCSRSRRVLYPPSAEANSAEPDMLVQIRSGEGEDLEFKPFLKPGADKFAELIKTVVAFANKRGGTIYLGVSDYQEIDGVDKELWDASPKEAGNSLDDRAKWYCALTRKLVSDRVSNRIDFRVEAVRVVGKLLIVVAVKEAKDRPCSDVATNEIWTRRGANTVRAGTEELKQLIPNAMNPAGFFDPA